MKKNFWIILIFCIFTVVSRPSFADDAKELYSLGMQYLKQGDIEFAFAKLNHLIEFFPDSQYADEALFRVAEYHLKSNNIFDAERQLLRHQKSYPNSRFKNEVDLSLRSITASRLLTSAELSLKNGDLDKVFDIYPKITALKPMTSELAERFAQLKEASFGAVMLKADKVFDAEEYTSALSLYESANTLGVKSVLGNIEACKTKINFENEQKSKGLVKFEGNWISEKEMQVKLLLESGEIYLTREDWSVALSYFQQAWVLSGQDESLRKKIDQCNQMLEFEKTQSEKGLVKFEGTWMTPIEIRTIGEQRAPRQEPIVLAEQTVHASKSLKGGYVACLSEDLFNQFVSAVGDKDERAVRFLLENGCVIPKTGVEVSVLETDSWKGTAKVRAYAGKDAMIIWTNIENIQESR